MSGSVPRAIESPIAFSILLAEFDIDTGFCLRAKYPERLTCLPTNAERNIHVGNGSAHRMSANKKVFDLDAYDDYCASHMLPDGAEKQAVSRTVFVINRPRSRQTESFPVYYFTLAAPPEEWVRHAKATHPFSSELLYCDKTTGEFTIRWQERVVMNPLNPVSHSGPQVMSTLPPSVRAFTRQLHKRPVLRDAETTTNAPSWRREEVGYAFVVICAGSSRHGLLVQSVHLERLMQSITPHTTTATTVTQNTDVIKALPVSGDIPPLYGLCAVVTRKDTSVRRGGISKSVALLGLTLSWLEPFFPLLVETALQCCDVKGKDKSSLEQQEALLRCCYDAVNGAADLLRRRLPAQSSALEEDVIRLCTRSCTSTCVSYTVSPFGTSHHLQIPFSPEIRYLTFLRYGLDQLLEVCGPSFWTVVMAILLKKRIVVLSRKGVPNDVCEAALSLGLIGNLLDPNFISTKVFPYTSVNGYLHFNDVPGYIVGTLNPIFEVQYAWWDVLCDLDNRCVLVSTSQSIKKTIASEGLDGVNRSPADMLFIKDLFTRIYHLAALHVSPSERHHTVLLMLEEYLNLMVVIGNSAEGWNSAIPRCLQTACVTPIAIRLRAGAHLGSMLDDMPQRVFFGGEDPQLLVFVAVLRRAANCSETELLHALQHLLTIVRSEKVVLLFLRSMPLALGGLNPLAAQLLHSSTAVRRATTELLRRVQSVSFGSVALASNIFFMCLYEESCGPVAATLSYSQ